MIVARKIRGRRGNNKEIYLMNGGHSAGMRQGYAYRSPIPFGWRGIKVVTLLWNGRV